jgi:uncharacterized protein YraI
MTRPVMRLRFAALALLFILISFPVGLALAQEAVVTRNVNLRRDPSTNRPPIRLLVPPDTVAPRREGCHRGRDDAPGASGTSQMDANAASTLGEHGRSGPNHRPADV